MDGYGGGFEIHSWSVLPQGSGNIFSSPESKAQVSFTVVVIVVNFHSFIFFSRTTWSISTKLGTKHHWVKGIQVFTNI